MKKNKLLLALLCGLLVACQSAPPVKPAEPPAEKPAPAVETPAPTPVPEPAPAPVVPDTIQATRDGFSPRAASPNNTLGLTIQWGSPKDVVSWAVAIVGADGKAVRTFRGTTTVPTLSWDGLDDASAYPPQGRYHALLQTAGADGVLTDKDTSEPFLLDLVPPSGTITVTPTPFVLGPPDAIVTPRPQVTLAVNIVNGGAPWTTWRLAVLSPDGTRFRDFISEENRDNSVVWDGRAVNNAQLTAGVTYRLEAEVFDVYGNKGVLTGTLPVEAPPAPAVETPAPVVEAPAPAPAPVAEPAPEPAPPTPVVVTLDGKLLAELPIYFAPYSPKLETSAPERRAANQKSLEKLAELMKTAQSTPVLVIGHANHVLYQDPAKMAYEQTETLLPLSLARAETVRDALAGLGVPKAQMEVKGVGGSQPLAAFSDAVNRWMNRRVVIELMKP